MEPIRPSKNRLDFEFKWRALLSFVLEIENTVKSTNVSRGRFFFSLSVIIH